MRTLKGRLVATPAIVPFSFVARKRPLSTVGQDRHFKGGNWAVLLFTII